MAAIAPLVTPSQNKCSPRISSCNACIREELVQLLLWRDWRKTILTFVILQALIYDVTHKSAISVIGVSSLIAISIPIFYRLYVRWLQWQNKTSVRGNPYQPYLDMPIAIPAETAQHISNYVFDKINSFLVGLRAVVLAENPLDTFKWILILIAMICLGEICCATTLVQLGLVLLFSLPKLSEWKTLMDIEVGAFAKSFFFGYWTKLTQAENKLEPRGNSFPKEQCCGGNKQKFDKSEHPIRSMDSGDAPEFCTEDDDGYEITSEDFERFDYSGTEENNANF